jgi:hypothetical protein
VPAAAGEVFAFLERLENHWAIADRMVEVVSLSSDGGTVRLRGPLGVRRTFRTRVVTADPSRSIEGTAERRATRARVRWSLEQRGTGTVIRLTARVERVGTLDRVLLALGGRWWLRRRFEAVLRQMRSRSWR